VWPRRRDPAVEAAWAGFVRFARALDEGSRALLATVPSARRPGAPLQASVAGFLAGVEAARAELPAWALPDLAGAQAASAAALAAAERRARGLATATEGLDFEQRNQRVAEVLEELDPVQAAERRVRAEEGLTGFGDLSLAGVQRVDDGRWTVSFETHVGPREVEVAEELGDLTQLTCSSEVGKRARRFVAMPR